MFDFESQNAINLINPSNFGKLLPSFFLYIFPSLCFQCINENYLGFFLWRFLHMAALFCSVNASVCNWIWRMRMMTLSVMWHPNKLFPVVYSVFRGNTFEGLDLAVRLRFFGPLHSRAWFLRVNHRLMFGLIWFEWGERVRSSTQEQAGFKRRTRTVNLVSYFESQNNV